MGGVGWGGGGGCWWVCIVGGWVGGVGWGGGGGRVAESGGEGAGHS